MLWRSKLDDSKLTIAELLDKEISEGIYLFMPQWDDQMPK